MQPSVPSATAYHPNMQNFEHNRTPSSNQQYVYSAAAADPRGTHGPSNPNYPKPGAPYAATNVTSPLGTLPSNQMRIGHPGPNEYQPYQSNVAQVPLQQGQPLLPSQPQTTYGNQHNIQPQPTPGYSSANTTSYNNLPSAQHPNADPSVAYSTQVAQGATSSNGYNTTALTSQMNRMTVTNQGFNKLWGTDHVNLLEQKNIVPPHGRKPPEITFHQDYMTTMNCNPEIFRCTLTRIPESKALLNKSRLPLGILIHPFKDLTQLPVIQCSTIVRCRSCRTYINPYVYFVDSRRWKCNLCSRVNDLPEEFQYDPVSKTYGDPSRRPEVRSATIEFLAPADYMVRPPQAAIYLYLLDISATAVDTGYLKQVCNILLENMDQLPGDSRAQIGFIAYDSSVHFFSLAENLSQPHEMVVCDIDDIFIPCPDDLLVSITNNRQMIESFISLLPTRYKDTADNGSALGAAMLAAQKLLAPVGGRITVLQCSLPSVGPGKLASREVPGKTSIKEVKAAINPSTDFYKKLALDCSSQFIAVDIFFLGNSYMDIASISCASKFSGGSNYYFPNYRYVENSPEAVLFEQGFHRYVTRKIGFEAVMRVRCSRGLSIHTFHGNFFVRSTDLLSLPNCNPDAGFGMQVSIDENLVESQQVCFQAALLYTSSKGERRIRVHTLCLPVVGNINDVLAGADQESIMGLVAKMAVDKSLDSGIGDAREAFLNVVTDVLSSYRATQNIGTSYSLIAPHSLKLLPLFTHAMLRSPGFRTDANIRLDVRVHFLNQLKTLPLFSLIQLIYPDLYPIHDIFTTPLMSDNADDEIPNFTVTHLSASQIEARGVYLLDKPDCMWFYVGRSVSRDFLVNIFNVPSFEALQPQVELPQLDNVFSKRLQNFVNSIQMAKPHYVPLKIMREDSKDRLSFFHNLVEDRSDSGTSYYEFLQQIKTTIT